MDEKARQLGMPFGTANGRLRKKVLFSLVVKYNENICYRCKAKILSIDEFTIEHKQPWLHVSVDLFWDIDNIAFSHLVCNVSAASKPWGMRANAPEGTLWCSKCKDYRAIEIFTKNKNKKSGYSDYCSPHHVQEVDTSRRARGLRPALK